MPRRDVCMVESVICSLIGGGILAEELRLDVLQVLALLLIINELGDGGVGGGGGFPPRLHRRVQFFKLWSPQFLDEERLFLFSE